ncbi:MAG TPA: phage tail protein [Polyangia bacterium]|jgi:phage tail-like protein|nr:phage tail protein [Polyangia bacterium]
MALFSPVAAFNFQVFMFPSAPPFGTGSAAARFGSAVSTVIDLAKPLLMGFSEVSGIDPGMVVTEYNEGGDNPQTLKFKGPGSYENLVLKRGVTFVPDLWDWQFQVLSGHDAPLRKDGVVLLNDKSHGVAGAALGQSIPILGTTPIAIWYFRNALPAKLSGPMLDAAKNEIAIEQLELSHEGLYRIGANLFSLIGLGSIGEGAIELGF